MGVEETGVPRENDRHFTTLNKKKKILFLDNLYLCMLKYLKYTTANYILSNMYFFCVWIHLVCKICFNKFTFTGSTSGDECSQGDNVNKGLVPQLLCIAYKSSYDPNTHMLQMQGVGNH